MGRDWDAASLHGGRPGRVVAVWSPSSPRKWCSKLALALAYPPAGSYREAVGASLGSFQGGADSELALLDGNLIWALETEDFDSDCIKCIIY